MLLVRVLTAVLLLSGAACASPAAETPEEAPAEVVGPITAVDRDADDRITSFTVPADAGSHQILIDQQRDYGFDLEHLEEHRVTGDPVRVTLEQRDGRLYAVDILDV
jgi:hypothetical protein